MVKKKYYLTYVIKISKNIIIINILKNSHFSLLNGPISHTNNLIV